MTGEDRESPSPQPATSGRKGSKKVRTGCKTCKKRKVKCDEQKPFCNRCLRTGRTCDGYLDAKSITQRRKRQPPEPRVLSAFSVTRFSEGASQDEGRSFSFFQRVTAPNLSGDFDGNFWSQLILQICQSQPAVKHAVLAVSSFHEGMIGDDAAPYAEGKDRQSFALNQHNMAIPELLKAMEHVDEKPLVPLLTCILFVYIEFMKRKDVGSCIHLEQGRKILRGLAKKDIKRISNIDTIKQYLVPMYTRLSITSFMFGGSPGAIPTPLKPLPDPPAVFETIEEIRLAIYDFMDECLRFIQKTRFIRFSKNVHPEEMRVLEHKQDYFLRRLARFNVAISLFEVTNQKDTPAGSLDLMQIHMHTTYIWISMALEKHEIAYDEYLSTFSIIISLVGKFLAATEPSNTGRGSPLSKASSASSSSQHAASKQSSEPCVSHSSTPTSFSFEIQVIVPLFLVATKCRHPLIRRAALQLLDRKPARRENLWRASMYAPIAAAIIKLEEQYLPTDFSQVPSQAPSPYASTSSSSSYSVSPPAPPFTAPVTEGTSHERIRVSRPLNTPGFRANINVSLAEQQQQSHHLRPTSWFDDGRNTRAFSSEVDPENSATNRCGIQSGVAVPLERIDIGPSPPRVDQSLIGFDAASEDMVSVGSGYSGASSFDESHISVSAPVVTESGTIFGSSGPPPGTTIPVVTGPMAIPVPVSIPTQISHDYSRSYSHSPQGTWQSLVPGPPTMARSVSSVSGGLGMVSDPPSVVPALSGVTSQPQMQQQQHFHHRSHGHQHRQHHTYHGRNGSHDDDMLLEDQRPLHPHQQFPATTKTQRSTEPPYDLPEEVRVHDVIIEPENEEGSWIKLFRRLNGFGQDFDVQDEFVPVVR